MANIAALLSGNPVSRVVRRMALVATLAVGGFSCTTLHETDLGANRGYGEGMAPAYKPSLSSSALGKTGKKAEPSYTPMVERTATGVRTVKDFSSQAKSKSARANAGQNRAIRTQQNNRIAKAYNDDNLLTR